MAFARTARFLSLLTGRVPRAAEYVVAPSDRYLVLAPHPDDETLGAGGLMATAAAIGAAVAVAVLTDGSQLSPSDGQSPVGEEQLVAARRQQCRAALVALGVAQPPRFLGGRDRKLKSMISAVATELAPVIADFDPTHVLIPHPHDRHGDHRACAQVLKASLSSVHKRRPVTVLGYEIWLPCEATHCLDITDVVGTKAAALECYRPSFRRVDLAEMIMGLNRYRAASELTRSGFAEAFQLLTRYR